MKGLRPPSRLYNEYKDDILEELQYNESLKEKFVFLHIKPYNKDIYNHLRCFTALLWQQAQSWELELFADVTTSWK